MGSLYRAIRTDEIKQRLKKSINRTLEMSRAVFALSARVGNRVTPAIAAGKRQGAAHHYHRFTKSASANGQQGFTGRMWRAC